MRLLAHSLRSSSCMAIPHRGSLPEGCGVLTLVPRRRCTGVHPWRMMGCRRDCQNAEEIGIHRVRAAVGKDDCLVIEVTWHSKIGVFLGNYHLDNGKPVVFGGNRLKNMRS